MQILAALALSVLLIYENIYILTLFFAHLDIPKKSYTKSIYLYKELKLFNTDNPRKERKNIIFPLYLKKS